MLTPEQDKLLAAWRKASDDKRAVTALELELREQVIAVFSTETDEMHKGTETVDLGFGRYELKIVHKLSYKLGENDAVKAALSQIAVSMEGGAILADRLVSWKPEISVSEYDKLTGGLRGIIDRVLTIKPAQKTIEIKQRAK